MLLRLLIIALLTVPASVFGQAQSLNSFFPFAEEYDSTRTIVMLCEEPENLERYPSHLMTPFQVWMTNLPLRPKGTPITDWRGEIIEETVLDGVIDFPIKSQYQTDADILILLALNFFSLDSTIYHFDITLTESDTVNYSKWLERDYEIASDGKISFVIRTDPKSDNRSEFQNYLNFVARAFDNESILLNAEVVAHNRVKPGNLYIQFSDDSLQVVSHVSLVLDVCRNAAKQLSVLVAYGGDPAQSLVVPYAYGASEAKWFGVDELVEHLKPHGKGFFYRYRN